MYTVKPIEVEADEYVAIMHRIDAEEEALREGDRIKIIKGKRSLIAIVHTTDTVVLQGEVGLLRKSRKYLLTKKGSKVKVMPTDRPKSLELIKKKMDNRDLTKDDIEILVKDITNKNLSQSELSAYLTAIQIRGMSLREIKHMTLAMVKMGESIEFERKPIYDFHSVGGCPGNKVTLIIVPIVAAAGLTIPKTSSRAISSAAGTADIFEVLANVTLSCEEVKKLVDEVGAVIAWGGSVNTVPADDIIIKAEYPLEIDPYPQILASVMAKKKAVNADYVLLDIPMGFGTKAPDYDVARKMAMDFITLGEELKMKVECAVTYGGQPVGRAIGPALEAKEALAILEGNTRPTSVVEKACSLAAMLLEMSGVKDGFEEARRLLKTGKALSKFKTIVEAQGGDPDVTSEDIRIGRYKVDILSTKEGYVEAIDNKKIVRLARVAGSPRYKGAGIVINKKKGNKVEKGELLFRIYSESKKKLELSKSLARRLKPISIEGMVLSKIPSIKRIESSFG